MTSSLNLIEQPLPLHHPPHSLPPNITTSKLDFPGPNPQTVALLTSRSNNNTNDTVSAIYLYKNDPKQINKGIRITDAIHPQGGYAPILSESLYNDRKFNNTSYNYNNKIDHGSRPMHKSTFDLINYNKNYDPNIKEFSTSNKTDFRGFQLRPEYIQFQGEDQFRPHFSISESNQRTFNTSYSDQFYNKNNDKEYQSSFDLMPKYSLPKQIYQLEKNQQVKTYRNRNSTIKNTLVFDEKDTSYWTQYKRTHDHLGNLRGNGVSRAYPDRQSYNVLTGEQLSKPSWSDSQSYKRVSGDVQLHANRMKYQRAQSYSFIN